MEKSSLKQRLDALLAILQGPCLRDYTNRGPDKIEKQEIERLDWPSGPTHQGQQYHLLSLHHTWVSAEYDKRCAKGLFWTFLNGCHRLHVIENEVLRGSLNFPGGSVVKNPPANAGGAGDVGLIPGLGRSPGGEKGHLFQCSCLENPMDRGARGATVHGVTKSQTWLSDWAHTTHNSLLKGCLLLKKKKKQQKDTKKTLLLWGCHQRSKLINSEI